MAESPGGGSPRGADGQPFSAARHEAGAAAIQRQIDKQIAATRGELDREGGAAGDAAHIGWAPAAAQQHTVPGQLPPHPPGKQSSVDHLVRLLKHEQVQTDTVDILVDVMQHYLSQGDADEVSDLCRSLFGTSPATSAPGLQAALAGAEGRADQEVREAAGARATLSWARARILPTIQTWREVGAHVDEALQKLDELEANVPDADTRAGLQEIMLAVRAASQGIAAEAEPMPAAAEAGEQVADLAQDAPAQEEAAARAAAEAAVAAAGAAAAQRDAAAAPIQAAAGGGGGRGQQWAEAAAFELERAPAIRQRLEEELQAALVCTARAARAPAPAWSPPRSPFQAGAPPPGRHSGAFGGGERSESPGAHSSSESDWLALLYDGQEHGALDRHQDSPAFRDGRAAVREEEGALFEQGGGPLRSSGPAPRSPGAAAEGGGEAEREEHS
eukprot:TRINITY_DN25366_c0_g1_i1.p1 TRINITY_DN25366_c0_g1~~TRINITY_DN25366_c0_g1_i1.p1  ORF type:complete len:473 (+),score=122.23 TRINITY_DN25366_c0_g1_i1:85-1419(+)